MLVSSYYQEGTGTYGLTANGLSYELRLCSPVISGTRLTLNGVGGGSGTNFILYTSTNVANPFNLWTPIVSNHFDKFGVLTYTTHLSRQNPWPNIATALGLELNFRRLLVAGGPATSVTVAASAWPRLGRVVVRTTPPIAALALLRPIPAGQDDHHIRVPKILPASPSAHWLGAS